MTQDQTRTFAVQYHMGRIMCRLSETYPGLLKAAMEAAQNGIDADATVIGVFIDQVNRRVAVCDNGTGITPVKFQQALGTIGATMKDCKPGTLGRFGLGLVAPVTKCQTMQVISNTGGNVHCWTFNAVDIANRADELNIPYQNLNGMPVLPEPFQNSEKEAKGNRRGRSIVWRTMVLMDKVTTDRSVSTVDADELAHDIKIKLGGGLKDKNATVFIKIREHDGTIRTARVDPTNFTGHRLEPFTVKELDAGDVALTLYRAKPTAGGTRRGEVKVAETGRPDAITWAEFRRQATGDAKDDPTLTAALDALGSGYFEGEITASRIQMHESRKKFERTDAYAGLLSVLVDWYHEVGKALVDADRELKDDERYALLGQRSLDNLLEKIKNNPRLNRLYESLGEVFPRAARAERSRSTQRDPNKPKGERRSVVVRPRPTPTEDGAKSASPAFLSFVYRIIDEPILWSYDAETAQLSLNVTHPLWVRMDDTKGRHLAKNDKYVQMFQEWLAIEVMSLLATASNPEDFERGIELIRTKTEMVVEVLVIR